MNSHLDNPAIVNFSSLGDVTVTIKSADESVNNSNVVQDDNEFVFTLEAGSYYQLDLYIKTISVAGANLKTGWSITGANNHIYWSYNAYKNDGGSVTYNGGTTESNTAALQTTTSIIIYHLGCIITAVSSGTLTFQWAQNSATVGDTTIEKNSFAILRKASVVY